MSLLKKAVSQKKETGKEVKATSTDSQTVLDQLYHLVETAGSVPLEEVPKILGISPEEAESFANILGKEGLISIHYPAVGDAELRKKGYEEKKAVHQPRKIKVKKRTLVIVALSILLIVAINLLWFFVIRK